MTNAVNGDDESILQFLPLLLILVLAVTEPFEHMTLEDVEGVQETIAHHNGPLEVRVALQHHEYKQSRCHTTGHELAELGMHGRLCFPRSYLLKLLIARHIKDGIDRMSHLGP